MVDDDERLPQVTDEYLQSEGFVTLRATDGQAALPVIVADGDRIRQVLVNLL